MPSLPYSLLRSIARSGLGLYYHPIRVKLDVDFHTQDKPIILIAKHSNALMDAIVLGTCCPVELHFLARADVFKSKINRFLLSRLHMLPVYRAIDGVDVRTANHHIFEKVMEKLAQRKTVALFPEGTHDRSKELMPIKKGFARLAWQYQLEHEGEYPIVIPVGIHYDSFDEKHRGLHLHFAEPIQTEGIFDQSLGEKQSLKLLADTALTRLQEITVLSQVTVVREILDHLEKIHWDFGSQNSLESVRSCAGHLERQDPSELEMILENVISYELRLTESKLSDPVVVLNPKASLQDDILATLSQIWKGINFPARKIQQWVINSIMTDFHFQATFDFLFSFIFFPIYWFILLFSIYHLAGPQIMVYSGLVLVALMILQILLDREKSTRIQKIRASILNRRKCELYTSILDLKQNLQKKLTSS